jgi:teichuronic acid biosynthesis glycosyltransferase TuaC
MIEEPIKKVVFISNLFPNKMDPFRGMFNLQIVNGLRQLCDVRVVSPLPYFPACRIFSNMKKWYQFSQIPGRYTWEGIDVFSPKYFIIPRMSEIFHAFFMFLSLVGILRKLKSQNSVDIVNCHYLYPDGVASFWACKFLHIPVILTALGSDINYYAYKPVISWQIKKAVSGSKFTTTVSKDLANKIIELGVDSNKIKTILNGVNFSLFQIRNKIEARSLLSLPLEGKIILFVGRLSEEKGINILLRAYDRFQKEGITNVHVFLIGEGPLRENLENEIYEKKLLNITFLGQRTPEDISLWLGASDLLCLPSLREGSPNVITEALSAGRPVVASNVGGIPELIKNDINGLLFESGDDSQLYEKLKMALFSEWQPEKMRDSIKNRSWESVAKKYFELYFN